MATLEIAKKAPHSFTIPILLAASNPDNQKYATLPKQVAKEIRDTDTVAGQAQAQLKLEDGKTINGHDIVTYYGKAGGGSAAQVEEWVKRSQSFADSNVKNIQSALEEVNSHMILRTHIVGHDLTVADLAVWGAIRGNVIAVSTLKKIPNNVSRWYHYIDASNPWIHEAVTSLTAKAPKEASSHKGGANYDIDIPKSDGPTVTRFPPEPSGYLHIGHAKAALLNEFFAHQKSDGILICRFDDTNPSKESMEFQDAILHDLKLMDIHPDRTSYSSDYFQLMYDYAIQLIKDGKAFAEDAELGKGDEDRKNRLPSKRRDMSVEETLKHFDEMKTGSTEGQRWCLRARIQYDSPNGTMRDPVIYRCNLIPHHRTGRTWNIYPTYDFCAPILDAIEGVTVALRTNEYRDRNVQYEWMQKNLGLRQVTIWDFSRMNFVRTFLSKRKLTRVVNDGKVWGWDDPRMPTIRGIMRRGMQIAPFREFILQQGPSRNVINLEWGAFWSLNKRAIDPIAERYTAVDEKDAVHCRVSGIAGPETVMKPKHNKTASLGNKKVMLSNEIILDQADAQSFEPDEEVTLMNWGNAFIRKITKSGDLVTGIDIELHLEGDFKKTKKKITWLAADSSNMIPVDLYTFDYLITKDKLEPDDDLEKSLTPVTAVLLPALADCNVKELKQGALLQFDRKGYFRLDKPYTGKEGERMVFFDIPSGRM